MNIKLPPPVFINPTSLEQAIGNRRSVHKFSATPLDLDQLSQMLWAAQGITGTDGQRSAPSAGALFPMQVYLAAGKVSGLAVGIYQYHCNEHRLSLVVEGDKGNALCEAARDEIV
jgi:nitroreductase